MTMAEQQNESYATGGLMPKDQAPVVGESIYPRKCDLHGRYGCACWEEEEAHMDQEGRP